MGTEIFFQSLDLPDSCLINKTIFKKQFYDIAGLSAADKKLFTNNVDKVIWQYCLKPDTINIQPYTDEEYEFLEVQVIEARLKEKTRYQRIAEIIMRVIPYPVILQFSQETNLMVVAGIPRINLADSQRVTIDEFVYSPWMDNKKLGSLDRDFLASIQASKLSFTNFFRFYKDFVNQLHLYNAAFLIGKKLSEKDPVKVKLIHDQIMEIEKELVSLRSQLKKETMFNRKVDLNIDIKQLEDEKRELLGHLNFKEE